MKKSILYILSVVSAISGITSCSKEIINEEIQNGPSRSINVIAEPTATKATFGDKVGSTYPVLWESQNALFSLDGAKAVSSTATPSSDKLTASFSVTFSTQPKENGIIYGASPAGDFKSTPVKGGFTSIYPDYAYIVVPSEQAPKANSVDPSTLAVFGSTTYMDSTIPSEIKMSFDHALAYGKMSFVGVEGVSFSTVEIQFPVSVAGKSCKYYTNSVEEGGFEQGNIYGADLNTLVLDGSNVENNLFWFACAPTSGNVGEMVITATTSEGVVYKKTLDLSKKALPFVKGSISSFSVNLSEVSTYKKKSMSSFSTISGLVDGDSNVSYIAEKGGAGTAPAVNGEQIRVYQNGGLFTVSANNGITIKEVVLGSAMATSVTYSIDGGEESASKSITANEKLNVNNIAVADNIRFKCTGTTSSSRLYVNYLSVSYVGGDGEPSVVKLITPVDQSGLNPALGKYDIEGMYVLTNIDEDSDPIEVTSSSNISNVTACGGEIEFDMEPNYTSSTANGTITLTLKSDPSVTATINVQQSSSRFVVSSNEIVIPANLDEVSFTVTSKYFNWTISSDNEDHLAYDDSGSANDTPVTVTVTSDVAATSEVQTIGTLTLIRNNNNSDPQKQVVVVKKEKKASDDDPVYQLVNSITSGNKYLLVVNEYNKIFNGGNVGSTTEAVDASSLISDDKIMSNTTTDSYAVTIEEADNDMYKVLLSTGKYLVINSSTSSNGNLSSSNDGESITIKRVDGGFQFISTNRSTRGVCYREGYQFKNYATGNFSADGYSGTFSLYEYTE